MADIERTHTVALTDSEMEAIRGAMDIAFLEYERDTLSQDMTAQFPNIRAKFDAAQSTPEDTK